MHVVTCEERAMHHDAHLAKPFTLYCLFKMLQVIQFKTVYL